MANRRIRRQLRRAGIATENAFLKQALVSASEQLEQMRAALAGCLDSRERPDDLEAWAEELEASDGDD